VGIILEIGVKDVKAASRSPHNDYPFRHCAVLLTEANFSMRFLLTVNNATGMPVPIHLVYGRCCSGARPFISMKTFSAVRISYV
jgi:hypothetical protein